MGVTAHFDRWAASLLLIFCCVLLMLLPSRAAGELAVMGKSIDSFANDS